MPALLGRLAVYQLALTGGCSPVLAASVSAVSVGALSAVTQEALAGVRVVRAYRQEDAEVERFRRANQEYLERNRGLIALLDPLVTKPTWTAVTFDHPGMSEAMQGLFENYWSRAQSL